MRPYYIYGNVNRDGGDRFHMIASLDDTKPKGYYFIRIIRAKSAKVALLSILNEANCQPTKPPDIALNVPGAVQASFIKEG